MPFSDPARPLGTPQAFPSLRRPAVDEMPLLGGAKPGQRDRLWDLSINLHCSIIGTCLSTADLRSLLAKLGERDAYTATDHALHGRAVARAGRRGEGSKLLHKLLDRRHEREVARFDKAATTSEVRSLWREAVERGEIPGAYWAVLTHPRTDHALVQEVFGEVHMLSHLVGRSVRADLRRLPVLEAELHERKETIAALEARVRTLTEDKIDLARRLAAADCRSPPTFVRQDCDEHLAAQETKIAQLQARLGQAEERAASVGARRAEIDRAAGVLAQELRLASEREDALRAERDGLQGQLASTLDAPETALEPSLRDRTLLYVGGRPRQVAQVRRLVERLGGALLAHDGGVEESTGLLPGLVARADVVLVPVDCVSHDAASIVKRCCREADRRFIPLRSASLAGVTAAIGTLCA